MTPSVATDGPAEPPAQAVGVMIARRFNGWVKETQNAIEKTRRGLLGPVAPGVEPIAPWARAFSSPARALGFAVGLACAACSDDSAVVAVAGDVGVSADAAEVGATIAADGAGADPDKWASCGVLAAAYCAKLSQCQPHPLKALHGDTATCIQRETVRCALALAAPGADGATATITSCAAYIKNETCDAIADSGPPPCWFAAGKRADGQPCAVASQCQGRFCRVAGGQACGVCATIAPVGAECTAGQCESSSRCVYDPAQKSYHCRYHEAKGGPCNDNLKYEPACGWGLACGQGSVCVAAGAKVTAACADKACNHALGLDCSKSAKTCKAIPMGKPGDACSMAGLSADTYTECADGGCANQNDMGDGKCAAHVEDGAACDDTNGPFCRSPARCTNKVCTLPDYAACK